MKVNVQLNTKSDMFATPEPIKASTKYIVESITAIMRFTGIKLLKADIEQVGVKSIIKKTYVPFSFACPEPIRKIREDVVSNLIPLMLDFGIIAIDLAANEQEQETLSQIWTLAMNNQKQSTEISNQKQPIKHNTEDGTNEEIVVNCI